ncbi:MAG: NDP-sugar synthase [Roseburia sp.]
MKTTLVIMAAGMGSRYGGIKQIEPVGPNGEIILDYSVYDAVKAGFNKVVFIIRKDIEKAFKEAIGDKLQEIVEVEYVFQDLADLPEGYEVPEGRTKPWGTGQAILACKDVVKEPFAVINADDYYGKEGFVKIHEYLCSERKTGSKFDFCMAGFEVGNTLSENGTVTRGVCEIQNGKLTNIVETSEIGKGDGYAVIPGGKIPLNQPVSMNMWGLTPDIFEELEVRFQEFLNHIEGNEQKAEYLIPTIIGDMVKEKLATVQVLNTRDKWFGVTYKEDREHVVTSFKELVEQGIYPQKLYA